MLSIHHEEGQVWLRCLYLRASPRYICRHTHIRLIKPSQIAVYPQNTPAVVGRFKFLAMTRWERCSIFAFYAAQSPSQLRRTPRGFQTIQRPPILAFRDYADILPPDRFRSGQSWSRRMYPTTFKLNSGAHIPAIGLGTWRSGRGEVGKVDRGLNRILTEP